MSSKSRSAVAAAGPPVAPEAQLAITMGGGVAGGELEGGSKKEALRMSESIGEF